MDHAQIDDLIARRRQWQEIAQQRWKQSNNKFGTILARRWRPITENIIQDLHAVAEQLITSNIAYKLVVSVNQAWIYTNDTTLIDRLDAMPELLYKTYTRAQITRPIDTIQLKKPRHQYRTYLRNLSITSMQKEHLQDFLYNQQEHIRVSPALQTWLDQPFNRTQDYFFVDHDSESWLTMLNLVVPGVIRKTMNIVPAK